MKNDLQQKITLQCQKLKQVIYRKQSFTGKDWVEVPTSLC